MNKILVSIILLFSIVALSAQEMTIDSAGDVNVHNHLIVEGNSTLKRNTTITGWLKVRTEGANSDTLTVDIANNKIAISNLGVRGQTTTYGNVNIKENKTLTIEGGNSQLLVYGTTNLRGDVNIGTGTNKKPLLVNGNTTMHGNLEVSNTYTLNVGGGATINGTTNLNETLIDGGSFTVGQSGAGNARNSKFHGTVTIAGTTTVNGQTNLKNTTVDGHLQVKQFTIQPITVNGVSFEHPGFFYTTPSSFNKSTSNQPKKNEWHVIDLTNLLPAGVKSYTVNIAAYTHFRHGGGSIFDRETTINLYMAEGNNTNLPVNDNMKIDMHKTYPPGPGGGELNGTLSANRTIDGAIKQIMVRCNQNFPSGRGIKVTVTGFYY